MSNLRANCFSIAHSLYQVGRDALGIGDSLKQRDIAREIGFVDAAKRAQECAQCCAPAFTRVAVDFASPIAVIIACPFVDTVTHGSIDRMHIVIARPFVGVEDRAISGHIGCHDGAARLFGGLVADDVPYLAGVTADHTEDRWAIVGERP